MSLPVSGIQQQGHVIRRKRDHAGNPVGKYSSNPYHYTSLYDVEFNDGRVESFTANLIAEHIYEQLDDIGNHFHLIEEIIDHRKDKSAVLQENKTYKFKGKTYTQKATCGWTLCVLWKDGSISWEHLKDLKESNPLEVVEYAVANNLTHEPAFSWWVKFTLKQRDRIIKTIKTRYQCKWQKYGIKIPKTVQCALEIDEETGTDFWHKAL